MVLKLRSTVDLVCVVWNVLKSTKKCVAKEKRRVFSSVCYTNRTPPERYHSAVLGRGRIQNELDNKINGCNLETTIPCLVCLIPVIESH